MLRSVWRGFDQGPPTSQDGRQVVTSACSIAHGCWNLSTPASAGGARAGRRIEVWHQTHRSYARAIDGRDCTLGPKALEG